MHCLFFTDSKMWRTGSLISFPVHYLNKQPMDKAREGKKQLITSSFKAAANSNTQVPSLSNTDEKSYSVWKHTFNLSSEIRKLIPKDNEGSISASALQGRPFPPFQDYPFQYRHFLHLLQRCITQLAVSTRPPGHCNTCFPFRASWWMMDASQPHLRSHPQWGAATGTQHSWADVNLQQTRSGAGLFVYAPDTCKASQVFSSQQHPTSPEAGHPSPVVPLVSTEGKAQCTAHQAAMPSSCSTTGKSNHPFP